MKRQPLFLWLRKQPLRIRDKAVLSKLCHYANDNTYEAGVRVSDLAIDVGCCERTIQTTLRHLENIEAIKATGRGKRLRSGGVVPLYRVAPELEAQGAASAPYERSKFHPVGRNCAHPYKESGRNLSREMAKESGVGSPVPAQVRRAFLEELGEGWVISYLDRCEWNAADRTLTPRTDYAGGRIKFEAERQLKALRISVLKRNG
jgi:hypothetical protein